MPTTTARSFCTECSTVQPYELDAAGIWICRECGFSIVCVECGDQMQQGHQCRTAEG